MTAILLRGGTVLTGEGAVEADVRVEDGTITALGRDVDTAGAEILDCSGCWVGPGLVDLHVHLREPGQEWKEDVASGSAAAAAGGFTAVVAMPNTDPAIDSGHLAAHIADRGRRVGLVDVAVAGAITAGRAGERLAHLDELWAAGVRVFSDDGDSVADAGLLRRAMEYLADLGAVVAQHAEDVGLSRGGHLHEGAVSARLGMTGIPAEAEETVVARDLALVRLTGVAYHVQHVSTAGTVELVRRAKDEGLPVTAEVAPHHLVLDHTATLGTDSAYKMYPPLRTPDDVAALREALASGVIDAVATDHAPHAAHEKDVPFEEAPRGVTGLETAIPLVLDALDPDIETFFDRMAVRPARIGGLLHHGLLPAVGGPATLSVVDPDVEWVFDQSRSKSRNSPFLGATLRGAARHVVVGGRVSVREGKVAW
ncbi:MAG: dihydroorotase [Acidimicrobiia bacterium]|nr:dihydroorotase [Acidimicrobiia bacterium]